MSFRVHAFNRMWREIRLLAASKPVVASMADVAASGGYYMAMGAGTIVAEKLTLTDGDLRHFAAPYVWNINSPLKDK
ncbi:hypothetical protein Taro_006800 [Colocasia esculenta]|uniref:Peptidase S49 domain-containing protein n=1 Tax=Colocasia esculenta TaxID=4460 RepID=A0A843TXZ2_COLES|nr:hypothetical protein [Colocasia esculenta]